MVSLDGTQSILAERHDRDGNPNYDRWRFTSMRNWGESARGNWTLQVSDRAASNWGTWDSWQLDLYGIKGGNFVNSIDNPSIDNPPEPPPPTDPYAPPSNALSDSAGAGYLAGTDGADYLLGLGGSDYIWAGPGDDVIDGSSGDLKGAYEWDYIVGGAGADTFVLGNRNHVYYATGGHADVAYLSDFEVQVDQVVLHGTASDYYLESGEPGETWLYLKSGESVAGFATNGTLSLGQFKYLA